MFKKFLNWLFYRPLKIVNFTFRTHVFIEHNKTVEYLDCQTFTDYLTAVSELERLIDLAKENRFGVTGKLFTLIGGKVVTVTVIYPDGYSYSFDPNNEPERALNAQNAHNLISSL